MELWAITCERAPLLCDFNDISHLSVLWNAHKARIRGQVRYLFIRSSSTIIQVQVRVLPLFCAVCSKPSFLRNWP